MKVWRLLRPSLQYCLCRPCQTHQGSEGCQLLLKLAGSILEWLQETTLLQGVEGGLLRPRDVQVERTE